MPVQWQIGAPEHTRYTSAADAQGPAPRLLQDRKVRCGNSSLGRRRGEGSITTCSQQIRTYIGAGTRYLRGTTSHGGADARGPLIRIG